MTKSTEPTELRNSVALLLAACSEETNRADKAEADAAFYREKMTETDNQLTRYRVSVAHQFRQRARLWSEKRLAEEQLKTAREETIEARRRWLALVEEGFAHPGVCLVIAKLKQRAEGAEAEVARLLQMLTPTMASVTICGEGQESQ